jgi:anti-sigma regulatory factor (Ser/Thr protein kinase)
MTLELRDGGPEFDPTQSPAAGPEDADDDRLPGGWGIHLVRRYMDKMIYRREGSTNVLRLTRRLGQREGQK